MNTNQTNSPQRLIYMQPWELLVDPQVGVQQGYLGVAAAFLIDGVECLIIAKDCNDLIVVDDVLNPGVDNFNPNLTHPVAVITQNVVSMPVAEPFYTENDRASGAETVSDDPVDEEDFGVQVHPKTAVPVDDDEL